MALAPVLDRLRGVLREAGLLAAATQAMAAEQEQAEIEAGSAVEQFGDQVAREQPPLAWAWSAVDLFGRAGVTTLGRSKPTRRAAHRDRELADGLQQLSDAHALAGWLSRLLADLDDEPLLILHPALGRRYRVTISGVAYKFNYTLCWPTPCWESRPMAGWPGSGRRPRWWPPRAARPMLTRTWSPRAFSIWTERDS